MSNLQTYYHFNLDFQKVNQHTEASGQSTAPSPARAISCKAGNSPVEYPSRECKHHTEESKENMFNPISRRMSRGRNIQGAVHFQNQNYLCKESLTFRSKGIQRP